MLTCIVPRAPQTLATCHTLHGVASVRGMDARGFSCGAIKVKLAPCFLGSAAALSHAAPKLTHLTFKPEFVVVVIESARRFASIGCHGTSETDNSSLPDLLFACCCVLGASGQGAACHRRAPVHEEGSKTAGLTLQVSETHSFAGCPALLQELRTSSYQTKPLNQFQHSIEDTSAAWKLTAYSVEWRDVGVCDRTIRTSMSQSLRQYVAKHMTRVSSRRLAKNGCLFHSAGPYVYPVKA